MQIKGGQDLAAGVLFMVFGAIALYVGWDYNMGTGQRPGTGVLPFILSCLLLGSGAILFFKGLIIEGEEVGQWAMRPFIATIFAVFLFGFLIDDLGLVVTMVISMTVCALGTPATRWTEFALFSVLMVVISVGLFIWALGMPIATWPVRVPAWITSLVR